MAEVPVKIKPVDYVVRKWLSRARGAVEDYKAGVQAPKRNPIEAAISMKDTLKAKMAAAETWDKWESKLGAWSLDGWIKRTLEIGAARFPQGIEASQIFFKQFYEQFSKHLEEGLPKVYAIPRVTLEDAIRRAAEMIRHNAKFKFIKKPV